MTLWKFKPNAKLTDLGSKTKDFKQKFNIWESSSKFKSNRSWTKTGKRWRCNSKTLKEKRKSKFSRGKSTSKNSKRNSTIKICKLNRRENRELLKPKSYTTSLHLPRTIKSCCLKNSNKSNRQPSINWTVKNKESRRWPKFKDKTWTALSMPNEPSLSKKDRRSFFSALRRHSKSKGCMK